MLLAACSGGSSSDGGGTSPAATPTTGTFIDSPVDGLRYTTSSNPAGGLTSGGGHFQCQPGETMTFFLGMRQIGNAQPCSSDAVTVVSVLGATSVTDPQVVNVAQLLMTLATTVTPSVMTLPQPLPAGFNSSLLPLFTDASFDTKVLAALPAGTTLVTNAAATAQLQASLKLLTVTIVNGGTVTSTPAGINCVAGVGICSSVFQTNAVVTLTATGTGFTGWSGGCSGTGTCVVTMTADTPVTATFPSASPPATLTIAQAGTGTGTVTCSTDGGATFSACAGPYPNGTALVLQGVASADSTFTGWSNGTGSVSCTGPVNCSMTLNADSTVTATFALNAVTQFSVTATPVSANGGGGSVVCSANNGVPGPCSSYAVGTSISISPTPNSASNFSGWTNGTGSVTPNCGNATGACTFTLTANTSITANFPLPTLFVVLAGTGVGIVTSTNIAGINCGATCTFAYNKGTSVTLSAAGVEFTGWSGAVCPGTGTCVVIVNSDNTVTATFTPTASTLPAFPLVVSANGRYLQDQNSVPFLILGESPQAMIGDLSEADAELFLRNRRSYGFNTVWINLLCASYTGCKADGTTFDGIAPFTAANDLSTPNEAYFARADRMLQLAVKYGFLVILDPAETGSWLSVLQNNGAIKARAYGRYLGTRYKGFSNIVWMSGNDFQSWRTLSDDALVRAVALGIKDTDPNHIHTVELDAPVSSSLDDSTWAPIISLNAAYVYYPTYAEVLHAYNQSMFVPVFMVEANYEFENNTRVDPTTPAILRRQEYWTSLSGATGQLYGNHYTWGFFPGWQTHLDTPGAMQIAYVKALFEPRAWYELVPDQTHTVVTAGYGTFSGSGSNSANDYVTAARTPSGKLVIAYVPSARTVTIAMSQLSGPATVRWYDPVVGTFTTSIVGSPFANTGLSSFTTPGTNAGGDEDWVLILEVL